MPRKRFLPSRLTVRRVLQLLLGLMAFGLGIGLMVRGTIGIAPWDVLAQGVSNVTGIAFGIANVIISFVVLLLWIPLRERPGIGTVFNALLIGPFAQLTLFLVPEFESLFVRVPLFFAGLIAVALGTGLYIGASFGPGPRDGLMTGLNRRTGLPIWVVRTGLELIVLVIGWFMGGNVGLGTVIFALFIGPLAQPALQRFDLSRRVRAQKL